MLCAGLWHAKASSSVGSKFCCCMKVLPSVGAAAALQNIFGARATVCSNNWSSIALFRVVVAAASNSVAAAASKS